MKSNKKSGNLFVTISRKKLLEERDEDILGLVVSNPQEEEDVVFPPFVHSLFETFPKLIQEPTTLVSLGDIQHKIEL